MGRSHGGREMLVAVIGSKRHLRALASIKARNHELADPRATDEARAAAIAQGTPPMFWMTAGLHSPETGPPEMVMEPRTGSRSASRITSGRSATTWS